MTKAPGASIYMPPEALEDESRYDVTIDIFSLGVLAIFTLSQNFPKPLAATYVDENDRIVGRSELERRSNYMREVTRQFREGHPLVQMIQRCLKNRMRERPSIQQVMGWLEEARAEVQDGEYDANKLSLAQLLHSRNQQQRLQIDQLQHQIRENRSLREQNESLQAEIVALKQSQEVCVSFVCLLQYSFGFPLCFSSAIQIRSIQWPLSLNWRRGKDIPTNKLLCASSVVINGMVYCGGTDATNVVIQYNPKSGDWSEFPRSPVVAFAMTSLNGQLVLTGDDTRITVWDSGRSEWVHPYPPMPTGRSQSAAVGYQNYLIVACGARYKSEVEVLDSSSGRWTVHSQYLWGVT